MFIKTQTETMLDEEIQSLLKELSGVEKNSEKYGDLVEHISALHKLKTEDRSKPLISPDTVLIVAANLFGILRITRYERENVVNSKALGFIKKL